MSYNSRKITIGIVDYDVGNHASVWRVLHMLGYRCRVSKDINILAESDMIVLPGVGAFPMAMASLHKYELDDFLRESARCGRPLLGVCLGMQLLADRSEEHGVTSGLGLIPGRVVPIGPGQWHIGWNSIEVESADPIFSQCDGQIMYFNHSFHFECEDEHRAAVTRLNAPHAAIVKRANIVGIQFHPEKSQVPGHALLKSVVEGLCRA